MAARRRGRLPPEGEPPAAAGLGSESTPGPGLELPRVSPVGVLERPAGSAPRRLSPAGRLVAALLLALFLLLALATTVASLGRYCLTTDGADTRALPAAQRAPSTRPRRRPRSPR